MPNNDSHRNLSEMYVSMNKGWAQGDAEKDKSQTQGEEECESQTQDEAKGEVCRELSDEPMSAGEPTARPCSSEVAGPANEPLMTRASLRSLSQYSDLRLIATWAWALVGVGSIVAGLMTLAAVSKAPRDEENALMGFALLFLIAVPIKCWFIWGLTEAFLDICDALLRGVSRREDSIQ